MSERYIDIEGMKGLSPKEKMDNVLNIAIGLNGNISLAKPFYVYGIAHTWKGTKLSCSRHSLSKLYNACVILVDNESVRIDWDPARKKYAIFDEQKKEKHILASTFSELDQSPRLPIFEQR